MAYYALRTAPTPQMEQYECPRDLCGYSEWPEIAGECPRDGVRLIRMEGGQS